MANKEQIKYRPTHSLFSPNVLVVFFLACFVLYMFGLTYRIKAPSLMSVMYTSLCLFYFYFGSIIAAHQHKAKPRKKYKGKISYRRVWMVYIVSLVAYLIEHALFVSKHGAPPILLANFEESRFDFAASGYVHLIAMLGRNVLLFILSCKLFNKARGYSSYKWLIANVIITLFLDMLQGNRGVPLLFVFSMVVVLSFYYSFFWKALLFSVVGFIFLGVGKAFREYSMYGDASLTSISSDWVFGNTFLDASLYHLYTTLTYNFYYLDMYINAIGDGFYYGYFTIAYPFLSVLPVAQFDIVDLQRLVLGIDFYGALTATMFAFPYIDFGIAGCFIVGIFGYASTLMYLRAVNNRGAVDMALYAYHATNMFLGVYTYMFMHFYVIFNYVTMAFVLPYLCRTVGAEELVGDEGDSRLLPAGRRA